MQTLIYIGLTLSALVNAGLWVRSIIWKKRANEMAYHNAVNAKRMKLIYDILWRKAKAVGAFTEERDFATKLIALSEMPQELQERMVEEVLPFASAKPSAQSKLGFQ